MIKKQLDHRMNSFQLKLKCLLHSFPKMLPAWKKETKRGKFRSYFIHVGLQRITTLKTMLQIMLQQEPKEMVQNYKTSKIIHQEVEKNKKS